MELTRFPMQGLTSSTPRKQERDSSMQNHIKLGFECLSWQVENHGITYYGYSYSKNYHLTQKQLDEFELLKEVKWVKRY